jgi:hypothetical protein
LTRRKHRRGSGHIELGCVPSLAVLGVGISGNLDRALANADERDVSSFEKAPNMRARRRRRWYAVSNAPACCLTPLAALVRLLVGG